MYTETVFRKVRINDRWKHGKGNGGMEIKRNEANGRLMIQGKGAINKKSG